MTDAWGQLPNRGLVIIDMQEFYLEDLRSRVRKRLIDNQLEAIGYCAENNVPIAVVEVEEVGETIKEIAIPVKKARECYFFSKNEQDAFHRGGLTRRLNLRGVQNLLIAGAYASQCIRASVEGCKREGFNPHISLDLITDPKGEVYPDSVERLRRNASLYETIEDALGLRSANDRTRYRTQVLS